MKRSPLCRTKEEQMLQVESTGLEIQEARPDKRGQCPPLLWGVQWCRRRLRSDPALPLLSTVTVKNSNSPNLSFLTCQMGMILESFIHSFIHWGLSETAGIKLSAHCGVQGVSGPCPTTFLWGNPIPRRQRLLFDDESVLFMKSSQEGELWPGGPSIAETPAVYTLGDDCWVFKMAQKPTNHFAPYSSLFTEPYSTGFIMCLLHANMASQVVLVVKNPLASAGDVREVGSIPGSGRSSRGEYGNLL